MNSLQYKTSICIFVILFFRLNFVIIRTDTIKILERVNVNLTIIALFFQIIGNKLGQE